MPDFNDFASSALDSIRQLVTDEFKDHSEAALKDAKDFLESSKADLARWLQLSSEGQLTAADLAWLIQGKKDLARMLALKRAGVALARLDRFQGALINIAIDTASTGLAQLSSELTRSRSGAPPRRPAAKAPAKGKKAKAAPKRTPPAKSRKG